jgi:hypothetical protein
MRPVRALAALHRAKQPRRAARLSAFGNLSFGCVCEARENADARAHEPPQHCEASL